MSVSHEPPPTRFSPDDHEAFMELALAEARKSRPDPGKFHVGAVLVDQATGVVISQGHYLEYADGYLGDPGSTHAERVCFLKAAARHGVPEQRAAEALPAACAVYTTLEPCSARPGGGVACVDRILALAARVRTVYVGVRDPGTPDGADDPGRTRLEAAGIEVVYPLPHWRGRITRVSRGEE